MLQDACCDLVPATNADLLSLNHQSHVTNQKWYWSGLEILVLGALTAATAFFIGWGVEELIVSSSGAVSC